MLSNIVQLGASLVQNAQYRGRSQSDDTEHRRRRNDEADRDDADARGSDGPPALASNSAGGASAASIVAALDGQPEGDGPDHDAPSDPEKGGAPAVGAPPAGQAAALFEQRRAAFLRELQSVAPPSETRPGPRARDARL